MRLKEKEHFSIFWGVGKFLKQSTRAMLNKKTLIILKILIIIIILLTGFVTGLLISGFFGTFDNPSKKALDLIHSVGISGLAGFKEEVSGALKQNIRIPINYLTAQFSNPEKIYIDIDFEDYQKLEYKRARALELGQLITDSEDFVPARLGYDDKNIKIKLRLKGDFLDHLKGDKWSFRIKVTEDDEVFRGMRVFSIQDPSTRRGVNEYIHFQMLKEEGIIAPRYDFMEVVINGKNRGVYAVEEHFDKQLIESNGGREGVIIKFNEDPSWEETMQKKEFYSSSLELDKFRDSQYLGWFYSSEISTFKNQKIPQDPTLGPQFAKAKSILENFRKGNLKTSEAFDVDKLAIYFAIEALNGCGHGSRWSNIRYYYNPITSLIEPIGYDGDCWKNSEVVMDKYMISKEEAIENYHLFFEDPIFFEKYIEELRRLSNPEFLDSFFTKYNEQIERNVKIIHKNDPFFYYSKGRYYSNQKLIENKFNQIRDINAYLQTTNNQKGIVEIYVGNLELMPIVVTGLSYGAEVFEPTFEPKKILYPRGSVEIIDYQGYGFKIPTELILNESVIYGLELEYKILGDGELKKEKVIPWEYLDEDFLAKDFIRSKSNISSLDLILVKGNRVEIKTGDWVLNESLIIPPGYEVYANQKTTIDLQNEAVILSYSPVRLVGSQLNPIRIYSSDGTGQGLTILNTEKESLFYHAIFNNLTNPEKDDWILMGGVNIYDSPITISNVKFIQANSEDALNIIGSNYKIENSIFQNCNSDCFDSDFSNGTIRNSSFMFCGNDCIDLGTSTANIESVNIFNFGDKGMSAGEHSTVYLNDLEIAGISINQSNIGISSKDSSVIFIQNTYISNARFGLAAYRKKPEYGAGKIIAKNLVIESIYQEYLLEEKSALELEGEELEGTEKNVYEELYGNEV